MASVYEWFNRDDGDADHIKHVGWVQVGIGIVGIFACLLFPPLTGALGILALDNLLTGGWQLLTRRHQTSLYGRAADGVVDYTLDAASEHIPQKYLPSHIDDPHFRQIISTGLQIGAGGWIR